jgi:hypothetical protein
VADLRAGHRIGSAAILAAGKLAGNRQFVEAKAELPHSKGRAVKLRAGYKPGGGMMPLVTRNHVTETSNARMTDDQHHADDADCSEHDNPKNAGRLRRERRKLVELPPQPRVQPDVFNGDDKHCGGEQPGEAKRK